MVNIAVLNRKGTILTRLIILTIKRFTIIYLIRKKEEIS